MQTYEVNCYFPMRTNCRVTLYQDAHVPPNLPQFLNMHLPPGETKEVYRSATLMTRLRLIIRCLLTAIVECDPASQGRQCTEVYYSGNHRVSSE